MCRLFGLHTGAQPQTCSFWPLNAPDALARQSRQQPHGAGIGTFEPDGAPHLVRSALAAYRDPVFTRAAQDMTGTSFVAHVRYATEGEPSVANTHPFEQEERMFAHNGVIRSFEVLDRELAQRGVSDLVLGTTDSERYFALLTSCARESAEDVARAPAMPSNSLTWVFRGPPVGSLMMSSVPRPRHRAANETARHSRTV